MKIPEYNRPKLPKADQKALVKPNITKSILDYELPFFSYRFNNRSREAFYIELSTLFSSGLDIKSSFELLISERKSKKEKELLQAVLGNLLQGSSLSESMSLTNQFSAYEYYSVKIGEESGKLATVLAQLAEFFIAKSKHRRKVIAALSYPVMILMAAIGAVTFMLSFIVPMFKDVFNRFGNDLPQLTKLVIELSEAFSESFYIILFITIVTIGLFIYSRKFERSRRIYSKVISKLPVIGKLIATVHLSTFCSSMSLLIGAKVPLLTALDLLQKMVPYYPITDSLKSMHNKILFGESLHSSMASFSIYDRKMLALIKVGEEVNKLDYFFNQLSLQYNNDLEHQTTLLSTFLEPLIIVLLGVVVAIILIAMYLPMFQMSSQIGF